MLQNGKVEKTTKILKIELLRQMLIKIEPAIEIEVDVL